MQKIYIFFYRLISNEGNISFQKRELRIDGEVTVLEQYKPFEDYLLQFHANSTVVEIIGSMYLRESEVPLTKKPDEKKPINTKKNRRT